ncbi:MAG TPA: hypothetical protein VK900_04065, partial [Anaerolineales bacterium]|nr:hypothetical protein [Anaerolineales bacterium]
AVELTFRRYLAKEGIPFEVKGAAPFTEPDRYDVMLGGRRCDIKTFLISHRDHISQIGRDPQILLESPALVPSDEHAGAGHSQNDLYIFAFLSGWLAPARAEQEKVLETEQPHYLVHVMPGPWSRPPAWSPLGKLVVKSESEEPQTIELTGQDRARILRTCTVELPAKRRIELEIDLFSLTYLHAMCRPDRRIGIYSPTLQETHLIGPADWGNIWVYGLDVVLTGYMAHEEFSRRASFVPAGTPVSASAYTQVKSLAVPVSDLRPLSELFERVKIWNT